jgi:diguanylate cyclase (GGDEF)-like protein
VNPEVKLECHELGADDYVEKPFDPRVLTSKVMNYLEHGDAKKTQYTLDEVTGLYSRDTFMEIFDKSLVESLHGSGPMVLAMIRPDDLESLCELHDSQFHDQVIHQLASVLAGNLRKTDHIARWEEDKLVVLLTGTNLDEAAVAMEKVRKACQLQVEDPVGGLNALTVSIGMTNDVVVPSAEEAVLRVLPSVFLARAEGGNRTCTVSIPEINDERKELLIVEDDELITSIIRHRFSRAGFGVTHFDNGAEALSSAKEIQAALVILDVKLPKMDGFEILKNLRKLSAYQGVPVIMLTATGSEMDVLRGLGLGADDYIVKPFSPTELLARAQRMLRNNARKRIAIRRISAENPNETSCERVV